MKIHSREIMQLWGEQIAALPQLKPYLELDWMTLVTGSSSSDSCFVILCGNMWKAQYTPAQVREFADSFQRDLIYRPSTFTKNLVKILVDGVGSELRCRQWPVSVSDYTDHWDFGWSISIWSNEDTFECTLPSITIKGVKEDE